MLTPERALIEANLGFYEAFANADVAAMMQAWSSRNDVSCIHPGWQVLRGHKQVMASWRSILRRPGSPLIRCSDVSVTMMDQAALVTCVEHVENGQLSASNLFVFENGLWKLMHHQAGPFARQTLPNEWSPPPESLN